MPLSGPESTAVPLAPGVLTTHVPYRPSAARIRFVGPTDPDAPYQGHARADVLSRAGTSTCKATSVPPLLST